MSFTRQAKLTKSPNEIHLWTRQILHKHCVNMIDPAQTLNVQTCVKPKKKSSSIAVARTDFDACFQNHRSTSHTVQWTRAVRVSVSNYKFKPVDVLPCPSYKVMHCLR